MKYYLYDTVTGLWFRCVKEKGAYSLTKHRSQAFQFDSIQHAQMFTEGNVLPDEFIIKSEQE